MPATTRFPVLKRVSPGAWTAAVWCVTTIYPVVVYVLLPPDGSITYYYPRLGLNSPVAKALLALSTVVALVGCGRLRRRPREAFVLLLAGTIGTTLAWRQAEIPWPQCLAVDLAVGFIAAAKPRRTSLLAVGAVLAVLACYLTLRKVFWPDGGYPVELISTGITVIAWFVGNSVYQTRTHNEQLRAQAINQAITDERLRIGRELHDMVAHSIGIIALQAGAARRVIDTQPARARDALGEIETVGRETLAGLRRTLGALRRAEQATHPDQALAPPGLADLDELAATTSAAGVQVDVLRLGEQRPLPPEIDLAAYRIVQESVTNVLRHAHTASCQVTVDYGQDALSIEVLDDGRGGSGEDAGYGLLGMRERVSLLRGEFCAATRPEGGFRVTARLPVQAGAL
jgi:signal transduction histidine kinase